MKADSWKTIAIGSTALFICFLLGAILLPVAFQGHKTAEIDKLVKIEGDQVDKWGSVPGHFKYNYTEEISLFSMDPSLTDLSNISLSTVGKRPYRFDLTYQNFSFVPSADAINLYRNVSRSPLLPALGDSKVRTLNFGALSVFYRLTHKPQYKEVFPILYRLANGASAGISRLFYAMNAYEGAFFDRTIVDNSVLVGIDNADEIYSDESYGLNSTKTILNWVDAFEERTESDIWKFLMNRFSLTEVQMEQIAGKESLLGEIVAAQRAVLAARYKCGIRCDDTALFAVQWATRELTQDTTLFLNQNVKPKESIQSIDARIAAPPEIAFVIRNNSNVAPFNRTQAESLLYAGNLEDKNTLISPKNLYDFNFNYEKDNLSGLQKRFLLNDTTQVEAINEYLEYLITNFGNFAGIDGTSEDHAFSTLAMRSISEGFADLESFLPLELQVRVFAAYYAVQGLACTTVLESGISDADKRNSICQEHDIGKLDSLRQFVAAQWYGSGSQAYENLLSATGITEEEAAGLFDSSKTNSVGNIVATTAGEIATHYECADSSNCTAKELATLQWGAANVTDNPVDKYKDQAVLKNTNSVKAWDYPRGQAPEYYFNAFAHHSTKREDVQISAQSVQLIMDTQRGLLKEENMQRFVIKRGLDDEIKKELLLDEPQALFVSLRYLTQDWLLGGVFIERTWDEIVDGYNDPVLDLLREGSFYDGADPATPNFINFLQVFQNHSIVEPRPDVQIFSGHRRLKQVKSTRALNENVYNNVLVPFYNGTAFDTVKLDVLAKPERVDGTDGLQFHPYTGDEVVFFDKDKLRPLRYSEAGNSDSFGDFTVHKYELASQNFDKEANQAYRQEFEGVLNISSAYNMPLGVTAANFHGCPACRASEVKVDGESIDKISFQENYFQVETDTGFALLSKRAETFAVQVRSDELAFPDFKFDGFVPVLTRETRVEIDETAFKDEFGFVPKNDHVQYLLQVILYPLAGVFFIVAGLAWFMFYRKMREIPDQESSSGYQKVKREREPYETSF